MSRIVFLLFALMLGKIDKETRAGLGGGWRGAITSRNKQEILIKYLVLQKTEFIIRKLFQSKVGCQNV